MGPYKQYKVLYHSPSYHRFFPIATCQNTIESASSGKFLSLWLLKIFNISRKNVSQESSLHENVYVYTLYSVHIYALINF